jgi:hypothetical protein
MYKSLTNGIGEIQEFSFLTKYATTSQEKMLVKTETEFKYLKFLKKCFDEENKMKDPNVRPALKLETLDVLEKEVHYIFKESTCWYLEKITFNKIIEKYRSIIDSTKHAESSLKEKPSKGLLDEEDL